MLIGELIEKTGVTRDTVRHYMKIGILTEDHYDTRSNGYRDYNDLALERITIVKTGQSAGFTLAEISDVIDQWQSRELSVEEKRTILSNQIVTIDQKIEDLCRLKDHIRYLMQKDDL